MSARVAAARPHGRTAARLVVLAGLAGLLAGTTGCAGGRFVRPSGAPAPFPDGAAVWTALSRDCREVTSLRAEVRVSGRVHGQGFPSLTTGLAVDADRLALDARAGGRRVFNLAGDRGAVVLLNHLDQSVARGPAADVTEALVGFSLAPARLLALLTGCVSAEATAVGADRIGAFGRVRIADGVIFLRERDGVWRLAAAEFGDVVADYRRLDGHWPREIELRRGPDVTLRLRVIEFERHPQLPPAVFQLQVPGRFVERSLDDLRRQGPLASGP